MAPFVGMYYQAEIISYSDGTGHLGQFEIRGGRYQDRDQEAPYNYFLRQGTSIAEETGWKVHLSIDPRDVPRATDLLCSVYSHYKAKAFKVARPETIDKISQADDKMAGRSFTLYNRGEKNWPDIMNTIEDAFRKEGIKPSHAISGDTPIKGSLYASYPKNESNPFAKWSVTSQVEPPLNGTKAPALANNEDTHGRHAASFLSWIKADSPTAGHGVLRADVDGWPQNTVKEALSFLQEQGIKSAERMNSKTFGKAFIQVAPHESDQLLKLLRQLAPREDGPTITNRLTWMTSAAGPDQDGVFADVDALRPSERQSVLDVLAGGGLNPMNVKMERDPTNRFILRVGPSETQKLATFLRVLSSPTAPAPSVPDNHTTKAIGTYTTSPMR